MTRWTILVVLILGVLAAGCNNGNVSSGEMESRSKIIEDNNKRAGIQGER